MTKAPKAYWIMIIGDSAVNRFMSLCDIDRGITFYGKIMTGNMTFKKGEKVDKERLKRIAEFLISQCKKSLKASVPAIRLVCNGIEFTYCESAFKKLSNGQKYVWVDSLADVLKISIEV